MANFDIFARILMRNEAYVPTGAYALPIEQMYAITAHNTGVTVLPNDPGGATMMGVTIGAFRDYYGKDKTVDDLGRMTYTQWRAIAKTQYWDKIGGDKIENQSIADMCGDWIFHRGPVAIKRIQAAVGTTQDGVVGPKTLAAINAGCPMCRFSILKEARVNDYDRLLRGKGGAYEASFRKPFMRRVEEFKFSA